MPPKKKKEKDLEKIADRVKKGIHRASDLEDPFKILVYARPKIGKTRLVSTLPQVLVLDINERGTKSVKRDLDPSVYRVSRLTELDDIYWFLKSGDHEFLSWAIDGVTGLQALALRFVMGDEAERDASKDPHMPSKQIWGKANELVKEYITNYSQLPMHGAFTALERSRASGDDADDDDYTVVLGPAVSPGVANHLEAAVDTIGRLTTKEVVVKKGEKKVKVKRTTLWFGPSERFIGGERDGIFTDKVVNPNLAKMIQRIEGGE